MAVWLKVSHQFGDLFTLEKREGARSLTYRYRFRKMGKLIEGTVAGRTETGAEIPLKKIAETAELAIQKVRNAEKPKPVSQVKSTALMDELVKLREPSADATYEQIEIFARKHINPFLLGECAYEDEGLGPCEFRSYIEAGKCEYASQLTPSTWLNYKAHFRLHRPNGALFNHWKFMSMLFRYAWEKGILKQHVKLAFDQKKEDRRKKGQIIPDELFVAFIRCAIRTWRDRAELNWLTGQRPGIIRKLRKDQVNLETGVVKAESEDSKNRRTYEFTLPARAIEILKSRLALTADSPFFFPMETDSKRPMDKSLKGWHSGWKRTRELLLEKAFELEVNGDHESAVKKRQLAALIEIDGDNPFTPHDIRHSFLTKKFKKSKNPALICYQCDLSLEEAMGTYIHFDAADTRPVAEESDQEYRALLEKSERRPQEEAGN